MPTANELANCSQCHGFQPDVSNPVASCGRCHQARYCSRACQKAAWPIHKQHCTPRPPSSTATINVSSEGSLEPLPDEIFYLQAEFRQLYDVTISGPFYGLEAVLPNLLLHLRESSAAMNLFQDATQHGQKINLFKWVKGPLDADTSKILEISLIRFRDPDVKAHLPRPVYNVTSGIIHRGRIQANELGRMELDDLNSEGTYTTLQEAEDIARYVLERRSPQFDEPSVRWYTTGGVGLAAVTGNCRFMGFIDGVDRFGKPRVDLVVSINYESGEQVYG